MYPFVKLHFAQQLRIIGDVYLGGIKRCKSQPELTQFNSNSSFLYLTCLFYKQKFNSIVCAHADFDVIFIVSLSFRYRMYGDGDYCKVNSLNNFDQSLCDNFSQSFSILQWARYRLDEEVMCLILRLIFHILFLLFPTISFMPFFFIQFFHA